MAKGFCPTCAAVQAVLQAARVPASAARSAAYSSRVRRTDDVLRGEAKRTVKRVLKGKALKRARKMSRHLKAANGKARKKNGQFKKGWDQARVMKEAHRLCRVKR